MTDQGGYPQYLYHYTSVDILALILQNRTIKFSSLDSLDDMTEGLTEDAKPLRRFVFVSCWTDDDQESIPMWKMYANLSAGVRIKLKSYPFKTYDAKDYSEEWYGSELNPVGSPNRNVLLQPEKIFSGEYMPIHFHTKEDYLFKVEYTTDEKLLCPHIVQTNSDQEKMVMGKLGKHKNTRWEFQKEFRYVLIVIPTNLKNLANSYEQVYLNMVNPNYINPISLFTLDIDDEAFSEMEVTLSPNISTGNQTIVELMKKSWNPSMIILESDLSGKLR